MALINFRRVRGLIVLLPLLKFMIANLYLDSCVSRHNLHSGYPIRIEYDIQARAEAGS